MKNFIMKKVIAYICVMVIGLNCFASVSALNMKKIVAGEREEETETYIQDETSDVSESENVTLETETLPQQEISTIQREDEIILDHSFNSTGNYDLGDYEIYVGTDWNGTTASAGVDSKNPSHVKIKQNSSLWCDAWGLQIIKKFSGLVAGNTYRVEWPMTALSNDASYITAAGNNNQIELVEGRQIVTGTFIAEADGTGSFAIGLGFVGLENILEFEQPTIVDVTVKDETTSVLDENIVKLMPWSFFEAGTVNRFDGDLYQQQFYDSVSTSAGENTNSEYWNSVNTDFGVAGETLTWNTTKIADGFTANIRTTGWGADYSTGSCVDAPGLLNACMENINLKQGHDYTVSFEASWVNKENAPEKNIMISIMNPDNDNLLEGQSNSIQKIKVASGSSIKYNQRFTLWKGDYAKIILSYGAFLASFQAGDTTEDVNAAGTLTISKFRIIDNGRNENAQPETTAEETEENIKEVIDGIHVVGSDYRYYSEGESCIIEMEAYNSQNEVIEIPDDYNVNWYKASNNQLVYTGKTFYIDSIEKEDFGEYYVAIFKDNKKLHSANFTLVNSAEGSLEIKGLDAVVSDKYCCINWSVDEMPDYFNVYLNNEWHSSERYCTSIIPLNHFNYGERNIITISCMKNASEVYKETIEVYIPKESEIADVQVRDIEVEMGQSITCVPEFFDIDSNAIEVDDKYQVIWYRHNENSGYECIFTGNQLIIDNCTESDIGDYKVEVLRNGEICCEDYFNISQKSLHIDIKDVYVALTDKVSISPVLKKGENDIIEDTSEYIFKWYMYDDSEEKKEIIVEDALSIESCQRSDLGHYYIEVYKDNVWMAGTSFYIREQIYSENVISDGETKTIEVVVPYSGNYRLLSTGDDDTYASLYEGEVLLNENDDYNDLNFSIVQYLEKGKTYTVKIKSFSEHAFDCMFYVEKINIFDYCNLSDYSAAVDGDVTIGLTVYAYDTKLQFNSDRYEISWYRYNKENNNYHTVYIGEKYNIKRVKEDDFGMYYCQIYDKEEDTIWKSSFELYNVDNELWNSYFGVSDDNWYEGANGELTETTSDSFKVNMDSVGWGGINGGYVQKAVQVQKGEKYRLKFNLKGTNVTKYVYISFGLWDGSGIAYSTWIKLKPGKTVAFDETFVANCNARYLKIAFGGDFGDRADIEENAEERYNVFKQVFGAEASKELSYDANGDATAAMEILCDSFSIKKVNSENVITISSKVNVEGFQISATLGGSRVVGSVEPVINNQNVMKWGFVYALESVEEKSLNITDEDMYVGTKNDYVLSIESSPIGTIDTQIGDSSTATYFVRTTLFATNSVKEFSTRYKIRAYALLEDGTYVYSNVESYSVYDISDKLYKNKLMNTNAAHNYLYNNILTVVNPLYKECDYNWGNIVIK